MYLRKRFPDRTDYNGKNVVAYGMAQATGMLVCITDRDQVIAVSGGPKRDMLQKMRSSFNSILPLAFMGNFSNQNT